MIRMMRMMRMLWVGEIEQNQEESSRSLSPWVTKLGPSSNSGDSPVIISGLLYCFVGMGARDVYIILQNKILKGHVVSNVRQCSFTLLPNTVKIRERGWDFKYICAQRSVTQITVAGAVGRLRRRICWAENMIQQNPMPLLLSLWELYVQVSCPRPPVVQCYAARS